MGLITFKSDFWISITLFISKSTKMYQSIFDIIFIKVMRLSAVRFGVRIHALGTICTLVNTKVSKIGHAGFLCYIK